MEDIFNLQWKLNIYTLQNIGEDFEAIFATPHRKVVWIENYRKALSAELAELIREVRDYDIGTRNGKVEIIDMLHFLVSISQLMELEPAEASVFFQTTSDAQTFDTCVINTFLALDDLQNSMKWKWWAKGGGYKPENARAAVLDLWKSSSQLCAIFQMDLASMKELYIAKNRINFMRQDANYSEDAKAEKLDRGSGRGTRESRT